MKCDKPGTPMDLPCRRHLLALMNHAPIISMMTGRLGDNAALHVAALLLCGLIGRGQAAPAPAQESPWREPGQAVEESYLKHAALRYDAEGRDIVGHNRTLFNNRPLYCQPDAEGVVLAGDRPFVRLIVNSYVLGGFSAAILRQGSGKWFHDYASLQSRYHCGRMAWRMADPLLPGVEILLEAVPLNRLSGVALRLKANGLQPGDKLVWTFGGAKKEENARDRWDPIMRGNPFVCKTGNPCKPELKLGMVSEWCQGNRILLQGQSFRLLCAEGAEQAALGRADRQGDVFIADAVAANPTTILSAPPGDCPIVCGLIKLKSTRDEIFWLIEAAPAGGTPRLSLSVPPTEAFNDAVAYLESVERVKIETPDVRLNAAMSAVCHPIDAACNRDPFVFQHGCMSFHIPFVGWRIISGSTVLGWHDRVKGNLAFFAAAQIKDDAARTEPQSDPDRRLCHEAPRSRFYGRGRISNSPFMYNTQSQFFDQSVRDWRWTADLEMEKILRPALELHLQWADQCFDPDGDGLYESYINTLPSDSVWYNGGGSVEESAYAYYAHLAAGQMAQRAGDTEAAARHQVRAGKIRRALTELLWLGDRGHFGLYIEQGGHHRVHGDAWVYSEFLPIDCRVTTLEQALQALYYTEWGLERIPLPFGGQLVQPSNWVPSKWSVRDMFGGDMWHLALACFQTGLPNEGWELLQGAMLESAYAGAVPGGFSQIGAGTDFSDCKDMFARAVVEGLFGYDPDYPSGVVHVRPGFPPAWPKASIQTPDYSLDYAREPRPGGSIERLSLKLAHDARSDFRLLVYAKKVRRVTLDGRDVSWKAEPGVGGTVVRINAPSAKNFAVTVETEGRVPFNPPVCLEGHVGDKVRLAPPHGQIKHFSDLQKALENGRVEGAQIVGRLADKPGHHLLSAQVEVGELPRLQLFKLNVTNPLREAQRAARTPRAAPVSAKWECLDLKPQLNGDVRTIFKQQYLSPRPKTCSVRIGVDGYSAWTFPYWGLQPPEIKLDNLPKLASGPETIVTPQNVPFVRPAQEKNIAFTSLWDNWPRTTSVPVGKEAETVWLLVCGSTTPMQTRIPNAEIQFQYADGIMEKLELVPPLNFWSLCPWGGVDYNYQTDSFCLPNPPPPTVQLGENCRAMVLSWKPRHGVKLDQVTLETLSQEVVIGLMGVSLMNPR